MKITFENLKENCRHNGWINHGIRMCNYKNGKTATCWSEWQECKEKNCCLAHPELKKPVDDQLDGQMTIEQYLEGEK